ncbi:MAG: pacearchaeosortase [Nanoarchaeota archaeon]
MDYKEMSWLIARYIFLVVLALSDLYLIYLVFTPLTLYSVSFILSLFYENLNLLNGTSTIFIDGDYINIIEACIAGSAYFLLLILNLSVPMEIKKRIKSISFTISSFFLLNVLRIVIFSVLFVQGYQYFDIAHKFIWYFGSTILIVIIWFLNVYLFKIKEIPVYSDIKEIFSDIVKNTKNFKGNSPAN